MSRSIMSAMWLVVAVSLGPVGTAKAQPRNLDIYWVDVEGGAATLMVSPSGESLGEVTIWQAGRHGALDGAGAPGFSTQSSRRSSS